MKTKEWLQHVALSHHTVAWSCFLESQVPSTRALEILRRAVGLRQPTGEAEP